MTTQALGALSFGLTFGLVAVLSLALGIANGVAGTDRLLQLGSLFGVGALAGLALGGLLALAVRALARRRPDAAALAAATALPGCVGGAVGLALLLPVLDVALDRAPPRRAEVEVEAVREVELARGGGRQHRAAVRRASGDSLEVRVDPAWRLAPGARLQVLSHPGALGWEWVERAEP